MSEDTDENPFATDDTALLEEIVASAEVRIGAQLTTTLAADQRALIVSGFLAAAIAGLVNVAGALALVKGPTHFLSLIALVASILLLLALGLAIWSARPVNWFFPGTCPTNWKADLKNQKSRNLRAQERAADCQRKIDENDSVMRTNGKRLTTALIITFVTLALSALSFSIFFLSV